jgi:hypothetical protein
MTTTLITFDAANENARIFSTISDQKRAFIRELLPEDKKYWIIISSEVCTCGKRFFLVVADTFTGTEGKFCADCSFEGIPGL